MKKVLFLTYYWPPAGGSGVQRPLKFVKYLRGYGWEPVVYTAQNGEYPELDTSLTKEVPEGTKILRRPILEPYTLYKLFSGKKQKEKVNPNFFTQKNASFLDTVSIWVRSNFFIPDARMWWIKPSVNYLTNYLTQNPVDAIISTGPPHSVHLIALALRKKTGIPWIADFRDPWTNIDYYKNLLLTQSANRKHHELEREVLANADKVVMVGETWGKELALLGNREVDIISNGYDEADFLLNPRPPLDKKFSIVHLGMFSKGRNHEVFWQAIGELVKENEYFARDLVLKFYGKVDESAQIYAQKYGLTDWVEYHPYVPHNEIVKVQYTSWVLYLSVNDTPNVKGILTGKIYEYLAVKRPILCIGPEDGDAAKVILETKSGLVSGFKDKEKLKMNLMVFYSDYINGRTEDGGIGIEKYSRKSLTGKLAQLLDAITKQ